MIGCEKPAKLSARGGVIALVPHFYDSVSLRFPFILRFSFMPKLPLRLPALLPVLVLAALLTAAHAQSPAAAPLPATSAETLIGPIKFGDITVDAALEMLERWSGRSVLRPAGLPATSLSFSLNQKVTRDEARQALETLLTLNGIAVTPLGQKFLKVTPLATARSESPPLIEGSTLDLPASGQLATKLFQLKFLRVAEFVPQIINVLQPAIGAAPVLFDKSNSALITDTVSNLQRVESLIAQLDQPSLDGNSMKFYKLQHSSATDVVNKLHALLTGAAAERIGSSTSYQADDRTNQVILLSDPRQFPFFDDLIAKLDTEGESSTKQEVIQLKHANAPDVATLLGQLVSAQNSANSRGTSGQNNALLGRRQNNAGNNPNNPNNPGGNRGQNNNAGNNQGGGTSGNNAGGANGGNASPAITAFNLALSSLQNSTQEFSSILTVVADERSNSLIVSGTVDDIRLIRDVVSKLDVLLAQVRIEVVIAEVSLSNNASTGIETLGLKVEANKVVGFSGTAPGIAVTDGLLVNATTGARELSGALALTTTPRKSDTNILSSPNIVTTHNREATIFVGEQRPVITSYQNTGNTTGNNNNFGTGYSSNVIYKDIGITLTVKPLIGNDGSVELEIKQDVNDILGDITIDGNSQPIIGSRTTESFVSVKSGEIIVLGGLQRKSRSKTTSRLAGIPIIGDLLGKRTWENTRTDLLFFLRPTILTNTAADNAEALARLQGSPQQKDVEAVLKGAPTSKR